MLPSRPTQIIVVLAIVVMGLLGVSAHLAQTVEPNPIPTQPWLEKVGAPDPGLLPGRTSIPAATEVPLYDSEGWVDPALLEPDMRVLTEDKEVVTFRTNWSPPRMICLVQKHGVVREVRRTSERGTREVLVSYYDFWLSHSDRNECPFGIYFFMSVTEFEKLERVYATAYKQELERRRKEQQDLELVDRLIQGWQATEAAATPASP